MKYILFICFCFGTLICHSQNKRHKYAQKLYESGTYADAAEAFEDVLARGFDSTKVQDQITYAYHKSGNAKKASQWFSYQHHNQSLDKNEYILYALLLCSEEKYNDADKLLNERISKFGSDNSTLTLKTELNKFLTSDIPQNHFQLIHQEGNTTYSEISIVPIEKNQVIFSSNRNPKVAIRRYQATNNEPLYDLFVADVDSIGMTNIKRFGDNTKYHEGPGTLDTVNMKYYSTRSNLLKGKPQTDKFGNMLLKIYVSDFKNGKLSGTKECSFNSNLYSCAHPTISADGKELFFSSNMPGSFGGMDIYKVIIDNNGNFSNPINLGSTLNTPFDEIFPFYHQKNGQLFFSSNGHFGYGGLDIYTASLNQENLKITNLGKPINSPSDDFGFTTNTLQKKGYISSNRNGGMGNDDIYRFNQFKTYGQNKVSGTVRNSSNNEILSNILVFLMDEKGNKTDSILTNSEGFYSFELEESDKTIFVNNKDYLPNHSSISNNENGEDLTLDIFLNPLLSYCFVGTVQEKNTLKYLSDVAVLITTNDERNNLFQGSTNSAGWFGTKKINGFNFGDTFTIALRLEKKGYLTQNFIITGVLDNEDTINLNKFIEAILPKIAVGSDLAQVVDLNSIYYDYRKWDVRADAAKELDKIVKVMKENPNMKIELGSHTDTRGNAAENLILSEKRAKSAVNYIISQGINANRITAKGYGESKPILNDAIINKMTSKNEIEKAHQLNRRTEFKVISLK